MKTGIGKYIGLATLASISLTCDSNNKTLSSTIKDQKSDIENILTVPVDSNISKLGTRYIGESTSKNIIDTLIQLEIPIQSITIKDSINTDIIQIDNTNGTSHTTDTMQRGRHNNTVISDISVIENIKKILSKEECKDMCDKQIKQGIVEIIPKTNKIKFDIDYMRGQTYSLFTHFFTIEDTEDGTHLIFSTIQQNDKIFVTQHMDNIKQHINDKNGLLVKLLLTKGDLKNYIMNGSVEDEKSNIQKLYEIITNKGSIKYEGDELQFKKDVESIINLY